MRAVAPEAVVFFKRHPMDGAHYRVPEGARMVAGNLARFDPADQRGVGAVAAGGR